MARQKPTSGYDQRIRAALERGPLPLSVRELARRIQAKYPLLRGSSYGGVRQYVEGSVRNPRIELLRAMADVLRVRPDWLSFDNGAMTEQQEAVRRAQEGAGDEQEPNWRSDLMIVQDTFGETQGRLVNDPVIRMVVLGAWGRLLKEGLYPQPQVSGIGGLLGGYGEAESSDAAPTSFHDVGTYLGQALRAPFLRLQLHPDDLTDEEMLDYVTMICQGLGRLADAQRRNSGRDIRLQTDSTTRGTARTPRRDDAPPSDPTPKRGTSPR